LRIFIDSANIKEIRELNELGCLSGVTTNPSLVAKEKCDYQELIAEVCSVIDGPISAEVIALDYDGMLKEAQQLASIHHNVVIKIPLTEIGLQVISALNKIGIKTNATLIFSANQAILAARAGASYVSPFIGRIDDIGNNGVEVLRDIVSIYNLYLIDTEVIAASIRHPMHVVESAKLGSHIATVPYKLIKQMIKHPLTDAGIEKFIEDWQLAF
jgi:transaldolase